jgi:signal transduction histidine kinase
LHYYLQLGITRRLSNLKNVTEEFTKGNYKVRAEINGGAPEIRSLARSFNAMADQLDKLIAQQKAFAGDASHQLRTPLTALQLRLERATEMLATDPAGAAERIEAAMVETDRLQRLVEGLTCAK